MSNRFMPNDTVMYGGHGACTLIEVTQKDFGGEMRDYYVLRPAFSGNSVFYVPTDSAPLTAKMHPVSSADDIRSVIARGETADWIEEDRARQNSLKAAVDNGGFSPLCAIYRALVQKQREFAELGKKLRAADDRCMKDIEKLLLEEISFSFEIEKEQLLPFLFSETELCEK